MNYHYEPARQIPIVRNVDVIVVGGGVAGLCAAIAAARNGASTVLVEQFAYLGGTATASLMACINGFRNQVEPDFTQTVRGIAEEIVLKMKEMDGLGTPHYPHKEYPSEPGQMRYCYAIDTEAFKYVTLKMCVDAGVELMFHTYFCDTIVEDGVAKGIVVENKSGRSALMGKMVVDCSGDGDVCFRAGVPFWQVSKDEAPRLVDALMYRIEYGDTRPEHPHACDFGTQAVLWGPRAEPISAVDADELSQAEISTRLRVYEDLAAKIAADPELTGAKVIETPPLLGIRQTRFVAGEYKLTAEDAIEGRPFEDVVAISAAPIIHYYGYRRYLEHEGYDIPFRALIPKKVDHLLVAGRCLSSEQQPYESHRSMVVMMATGEAAGTAAALCASQDVGPRDLNVTELQKTLVAQGAELRRTFE